MFSHYEDTELNNIFSFCLNNANFDPEDKESRENFPQLLQADKCLTYMDEVECRARKKFPSCFYINTEEGLWLLHVKKQNINSLPSWDLLLEFDQAVII